MKKSILIIALLLATVAQAQQRDRRVDLEVECGRSASVAPDGSIWICTMCGDVYKADSIGASWRTLMKKKDVWSDIHLECVVPFDRNTAVTMGFEKYLLRTSTGDTVWERIPYKSLKGQEWFHPGWRGEGGRMWAGSQDGLLLFSADSGRTFSALRDTAFERKQGIDDIYMLSADSGWIAGHGNRIYSTTDNWRTVRRWATPLDQKLYTVTDPHDQYWVNRVRTWNATDRERTNTFRQNHLLVHEAYWSFITPMGEKLHWQRTPFNLQPDFEVDTAAGHLWARDSVGHMVVFFSPQRWKTFDLQAMQIAGIHQGRAYCLTAWGIVAIDTAGRMDTCGFYTEERTLEEAFAEMEKEYEAYGYTPHRGFTHSGHQWRYDYNSVYLKDEKGWYRIAKPLGISAMHPDPDREDRVIILRGEKNYSVDTAGRHEPYTYRQPMTRFLESGLQGVQIQTYVGGCFHFDEHRITYTRNGDLMRETENTVENKRHTKRTYPVEVLESSLRRLGEVYDRFPSAADFGLQEGEVDLHKAFARVGGCTSYSGYRITFVNRQGDTLRVNGNSDADCGEYFPWMLPMKVAGGGESFVTYQPLLWQALRPMMPEGMMHRRFLNNNSLYDLRPGDLLFFRDTTGMGSAVRESTGKYTHVALVESVDDTVWVIDATQRYGVSRRPLTIKYGSSGFPDVYRFKYGCFSIDSVLARARSFIGQPYDNAFLPDNGALYCSELVYEVFLNDCSDKGKHLIEAKPMNWRDKNGNLPKYWKKHFKKLGMPVPEGVPGTNPTDLSRSPMLHKVL